MINTSRSTTQNIVVNGLSARTGGGVTYLRELLPRLERELVNADIDVHLLVNGEVSKELEGALKESTICVHTPRWGSRSGLVRLLSEQAFLPSMLRRLSAAAVFHTGDTLPLASRTPNILLCRNMLLYAPLGKHSARLRALAAIARLSIRRASAVAFVSRTLAERVLAFTTPRRWAVIHHGPGLVLRPTRRPTSGNPTVVVVSSLYDYKRVELAIAAVAELRRRGHPVDLEVIGRAIEIGYVEDLHKLVERLGAGGFVRFTGEMDAAAMAQAYAGATLAMVTSHNESFCHPILEALAAGVPTVVPTDLAVAKEIAGDAAVYADPDGSRFADAAESLLLNDVEYQEKVVLGTKQAAKFSWDRTARETAELVLATMNA